MGARERAKKIITATRERHKYMLIKIITNNAIMCRNIFLQRREYFFYGRWNLNYINFYFLTVSHNMWNIFIVGHTHIGERTIIFNIFLSLFASAGDYELSSRKSWQLCNYIHLTLLYIFAEMKRKKFKTDGTNKHATFITSFTKWGECSDKW